MITLGIDIGSNSVGSAWVNTDTREIVAGVSVFPAGVEESDEKRGAPKNQARRQKRSQRRSLARRSSRKRQLRRFLVEHDLLPRDPAQFLDLMCTNPWTLRAQALDRPLTPYEFGRLLVHLNQRRGAFGLLVEEERESDDEDGNEADIRKEEEGKVKEAVAHTKGSMKAGETYGRFMARLYDERQTKHQNKLGEEFVRRSPVRNRRESFEFHADRQMIRDEFAAIWAAQRDFGGDLASRLTGPLLKRLDDDDPDGSIWRHGGAIFGQRKTYWNLGTLGRCDLEPTDQKCPQIDRYAQEFLVRETTNNIRVRERGGEFRGLNDDEQQKVLEVLGMQKTAKATTIRKALGWHKKALKSLYELNLENDPDRALNTNYFVREIVRPVFGSSWEKLDDRQRESVNQAVLQFDPAMDTEKLATFREKITAWWGLEPAAADAFIVGWKSRPSLDKRMNYSRRAIKNILPYMRLGASVTEARDAFAKDADSPATPEERARYAFTVDDDLRELLTEYVGEDRARSLLQQRGTTKADRHFIEKHALALPPAPVLSNPVVRKAVHEVRRHVNEYLKKFKRIPDRVVIEMARETKDTAKNRDEHLALVRRRNKVQKEIVETFHLGDKTKNQREKAIRRVLLCRQQKGMCPYCASSTPISETDAAQGNGVEWDHVIPRGRGGGNGLNNLVLCHRACNREKGRQTAKEWIEGKGLQEAIELRFGHFAKPDKSDADYFTRRDFERKWKNLHREVKPKDEERWRESQLSDTSYAARQVAEYLQQALFRDAGPGKRRIFFIKGRIKETLRRDWQLYREAEEAEPDDEAQDDRKQKDRSDHRHHALDAIVIALFSPATNDQLARNIRQREEYKERKGKYPPREPLPPPEPWRPLPEFRRQVLSVVFGDADSDNEGLVVSHRSVGRKIVGAFHEESHFGPVPQLPNTYVGRKSVFDLTPNHLRLPGANGEDPPPDKSGIVRDLALRRRLRECIASFEYVERGRDGKVERRYRLDPDGFKKQEIKQAILAEAICHKSGVPIHRIRLLRTMKTPVVIHRKRWDEKQRRWVRDTGRDGNLRTDQRSRSDRAYVGGNNHHIEIRENSKGSWAGEMVTMFEAAQRVRRGKSELVDRSDNPEKSGRFIMSLAEGEMVHMKHKDTGELGYFVVFKLDKPQTVQFKRHWDARRAKGEKLEDGSVIPDSMREEMPVSAAALRDLAPPGKNYPVKVRVGPLGKVEALDHD